MATFYGRKILKGEINSKTGKAWVLADVPKLWRAATEAWLAKNSVK